MLSSKFFEIFTKFFNRPCQVAASICKNLANSYLWEDKGRTCELFFVCTFFVLISLNCLISKANQHKNLRFEIKKNLVKIHALHFIIGLVLYWGFFFFKKANQVCKMCWVSGTAQESSPNFVSKAMFTSCRIGFYSVSQTAFMLRVSLKTLNIILMCFDEKNNHLKNLKKNKVQK